MSAGEVHVDSEIRKRLLKPFISQRCYVHVILSYTVVC